MFSQNEPIIPSLCTTSEPHAGQCEGILKGTESSGRFAKTTSITAGITSPAFSIITVSPTLISFRLISSSL